MPRSFSLFPIAHAFRTWLRNAPRSPLPPMADPPPVGGQTGATSDPPTSPFAPILSASRFRSSSVESMLTCGSKRNKSTPSNRAPFARAAAVRFNIVSRSIVGSAPGPPLPTRPGHIALCSAGNFGCEAMDASVFQRDPERVQLIVVGDDVNLPAAGGQPAARERRDLRTAVPHAPARRSVEHVQDGRHGPLGALRSRQRRRSAAVFAARDREHHTVPYNRRERRRDILRLPGGLERQLLALV